MGKDDFRKDLVRGSLIGGAIGDALGYAVEFDSYQRIISKYGPQGIREYDLKNGVPFSVSPAPTTPSQWKLFRKASRYVHDATVTVG